MFKILPSKNENAGRPTITPFVTLNKFYTNNIIFFCPYYVGGFRFVHFNQDIVYAMLWYRDIYSSLLSKTVDGFERAK